MRWRMLAASAVLAAAGTAAQRPAVPVANYSDADDGRVVRLPVGAELVVRLPERPGTGERWTLKDDYRFRAIGAPRLEGAAGGPVRRLFRVQVTAGGRVPLDFRLRPAGPGGARTTLGRVLIRVDASSRGPLLPAPRGGPALVLGERDAGGLVATRLGAPIAIRLPARLSSGYRWEVLSARNVAFEGLPGVRPGGGRLDDRDEDRGTAVFRLHTTVDRSDGFLTLGLMPPGERPDMHRAVRTLEYQFTNRR